MSQADIISFLKLNPCSTPKEMLEEFNITKSAFYRNLRQLKKHKQVILVSSELFVETRYKLAERENGE